MPEQMNFDIVVTEQNERQWMRGPKSHAPTLTRLFAAGTIEKAQKSYCEAV
jgi:hypothetical protein